jgi:DNA topoisomerase-1
MSTTLVIVESPAKCSKIQSYLGDGYKVQATMGHIRALDETLDSVGIERGWEPTYVDLAKKKEAIGKLKAAAKGCRVILATDDDREGEGIAWHVCSLLKLNPATTPRIVFHEITRPAIQAAVAAPRLLDMNKVNAQQARAMLDLLVGFTISKVLWNRVAPRLSAGRCQTPALRLVVERDAEVDSHVASGFWKLSGTLNHPTNPPLGFNAADDLPTATAAKAVLQTVHKNTAVTVKTVKESVSISNPPKPFITSTLQQEASAAHGLAPKVTMHAAQKLYEAGHITYMRTDNPQLSEEAATAIRELVTARFGADHVGPLGQHTISSAPAEAPAGTKKPAKAKKVPEGPKVPEAQAAHEAIRPTHPEHDAVDVDDPAQKTVYRLIWRRAMQCQMAAAQTDVRKATLTLDADHDRVWNAEQTKQKFAGWRALEKAPPSEEATAWTAWAPTLHAGAKLAWKSLQADEAFTKPKGRYTEASLIAELEKRGIGRPSTFATLVSTIVDREYVEKTNTEGKSQDTHHLTLTPNVWPPKETKEQHKVGAEKNKLRATALGRSVSEFLAREYNDLFNYEFTAGMEQKLDDVSNGRRIWKSVLQECWDTYKDRYTEQSKGGGKASRERVLEPNLKVILSKKGPLFVREAETPDGKAKFAALPAGVTFESATVEDANAAFSASTAKATGEELGSHDGHPIYKKVGPYGPYAEWNGTRIPLKGLDDLVAIIEKLEMKANAAANAYERKVGEFTIRRGPYGLYFFKHDLKRISFKKFPAALDPEKVTVADLKALYSLPSKPKFTKKTDTDSKEQ